MARNNAVPNGRDGNPMAQGMNMDMSQILKMASDMGMNPLDALGDEFKQEIAEHLTQRERDLATAIHLLEKEAGIGESDRVRIPDADDRAETILDAIDSMLDKDFRRFYVERTVLHPIEDAPDISAVYGNPGEWRDLREKWAENLPDNSDETIDAFLREVFGVGLDEFHEEVVEPWSSDDRGQAIAELIGGIRTEAPDRLDTVRSEL